MSWRRIAVLFVLVAALGAYLYFYEVPEAQKEATKEKLVTVDKDAVTGIVLTYPDREIELRKGDKGWRMVKPVDAPADEGMVRLVVNAVADAQVQKALDEVPKDLASFGLDKPNPVVRLTTKSGEVPPLAIGKTTAIGGKTYVRKGDEQKIYLTASPIVTALNKQPKDLRDKQIISFDETDVSRVDILSSDGTKSALVRKDKDAWTVEPGDHPADLSEVRSYLSSLRSTRAVDFPDEAPADLAKYGLDHPRLTVTVATGKDGATTQSLLLGGEQSGAQQKQFYAKRANGPTVYSVAEFSIRALDKPATQLRDKTVLGFDPSRVGRVEIARKDGTVIALVRAGDAWKVDGPDGKEAKEGPVTRLLDDVKDLRGSDIVAENATDLAPYGLGKPDLRVTLLDKEGKPIGTILATKHDDKYYVVRDGSPTVYAVRDYMYARLDRQLVDFTTEPAPPGAQAAPAMPRVGGAVSPTAPPAPPGADEADDASGGEAGDEAGDAGDE